MMNLMAINGIEISDEMNCYTRIFDCFSKVKDQVEEKEKCRDRYLVKLMSALRIKEDKNFARNALLLIQSLYDGEDKPADFYESIGKDINALTDSTEREALLSELKNEFLP